MTKWPTVLNYYIQIHFKLPLSYVWKKVHFLFQQFVYKLTNKGKKYETIL